MLQRHPIYREEEQWMTSQEAQRAARTSTPRATISTPNDQTNCWAIQDWLHIGGQHHWVGHGSIDPTQSAMDNSVDRLRNRLSNRSPKQSPLLYLNWTTYPTDTECQHMQGGSKVVGWALRAKKMWSIEVRVLGCWAPMINELPTIMAKQKAREIGTIYLQIN